MLINWYLTGDDYISAHQDKTDKLIPGSSIVSISLNEGIYKRTFRVTKALIKDGKIVAGKKKSDIAIDLKVGNKDVVIMRGDMQKNYFHEIIKETTKGKRINITFRKVI